MGLFWVCVMYGALLLLCRGMLCVRVFWVRLEFILYGALLGLWEGMKSVCTGILGAYRIHSL